MSRTTTDASERVLPARSTGRAIWEITGMSIGTVMLGYGAFNFLSGDADAAAQLRLAAALGEGAIAQIGWALGIAIPLLALFCVTIIGGQILGGPTALARTRRILGLSGEVTAAALLPAIVLVFIAGAAHPAKNGGALFVLAPAAAGLFVLATVLGRFIVFERELQIVFAEETRAWADGQLAKLRHQTRCPIVLVTVTNLILGALIGAVVSLPFGLPMRSLPVVLGLCLLLEILLMVINAGGVYLFQTARDRTTKVLVWLFPGLVILSVGRVAVESIVPGKPPATAAVLIVIGVFCVLTAVIPHHGSGRVATFLCDWTMNGVVTTISARSVTRSHDQASDDLLDLRAHPAPPPETIRQRLLAALRGWPPGDWAPQTAAE